MPQIVFYDMSDDEAEAFLEAYLDAGPGRLDWLRKRTGLSLPPDRQALVDFWGWVLRWHDNGGRDEPTDAPMPLWLAWDPAIDPYKRAEAVVMDAGSYLYSNALLASDPRLRWEIDRRKDSAFENQPVLVGSEFPVPGWPLLGPMHFLATAGEAQRADPFKAAYFQDDLIASIFDKVTKS